VETAGPEASAPRRRGRPRAGDPDRISEVAFRLITERGYAGTTMTDVAEAAGISVPTLFRYFPSKSALLWHGMEDSARLFRQAFRTRPASSDLVDAIFAAYLDMLHASPVRLLVIKRRIAIVSHGGESADAAWLRFEEWSAMVTEFVAERRGVPADSLEATVLGGMIWTALWTAISRWAVADDSDPAGLVDQARAYVTLPG